MTTTTFQPTAVSGGSRRRIAAVVKLHFTNPWNAIYLPWLIMGAIIVLNVLIWWLIFTAADSPTAQNEIRDGMQYNGAASYFFVYMLVVAVQSISSYFPFALSYGATRRDYYLGASVSFVLLAMMYSLGLSALALIEEATGGWGFGGTIFTVAYFGDGAAERLFIFFAALLFFFFVGAAVASVYVRWRAKGITAFFIVLAFVLVGLGAVITQSDSWPAVGDWFAGVGLVGGFAWSLVLTAVAWVTGYLVLRKATPRS